MEFFAASLFFFFVVSEEWLYVYACKGGKDFMITQWDKNLIRYSWTMHVKKKKQLKNDGNTNISSRTRMVLIHKYIGGYCLSVSSFGCACFVYYMRSLYKKLWDTIYLLYLLIYFTEYSKNNRYLNNWKVIKIFLILKKKKSDMFWFR